VQKYNIILHFSCQGKFNSPVFPLPPIDKNNTFSLKCQVIFWKFLSYFTQKDTSIFYESKGCIVNEKKQKLSLILKDVIEKKFKKKIYL